MKISKIFERSINILLVVFILLLIISALGTPIARTDLGEVNYVKEVISDNKSIELPHTFVDLEGNTKVVVTMDVDYKLNDYIYLKSVYAPLTVYIDDILIYEFGAEGTYPSFMIDPATGVSIVKLPNETGVAELRMEFLSPNSRTSLIVHPPIIGQYTDILNHLLNQQGLPLLFSLLQLILAVIVLFIAIFSFIIGNNHKIFMWLGFFLLATGCWSFGEYNLTGIFIKNHTFLYLLAFIGLYLITATILKFTMNFVSFRNPKLLKFTYFYVMFSCVIAFALQYFDIMSFSTNLYYFHIILPLSLTILTTYTIIEAVRFREKNAIRIAFPLAILTLSSIMELLNYRVEFTNVFSSVFQVGIIFFTISVIYIGNFYAKDILELKVSKHELEYRVKLMEIQASEQKKYMQLVSQTSEINKQQQHDFRHQLKVIRALADESDKLLEYLSDIEADIPNGQEIFCDNIAVNTIVSHYYTLCNEKNINISINIDVPFKSKETTDSELCAVFANLLENAFDANFSLNSSNKFIILNSKIYNGTFVVTVDNSFDGVLENKDGHLMSTKRKGLGIGTASIKNIANKHGGLAKFEATSDVFHASVYFNF